MLELSSSLSFGSSIWHRFSGHQNGFVPNAHDAAARNIIISEIHPFFSARHQTGNLGEVGVVIKCSRRINAQTDPRLIERLLNFDRLKLATPTSLIAN
jgi:hypothetical protein